MPVKVVFVFYLNTKELEVKYFKAIKEAWKINCPKFKQAKYTFTESHSPLGEGL